MKKVLVVEDDKLIREDLVEIIKSIDSKISILETGYAEEALLLCEQYNIDAFFLDIQLLDYSGIELAKQIRTKEMHFFTPVVFITSIPTNELEAFKTVHCYDYIIKPFSTDKVTKVFEKIINYGIKKEEEKKILRLEQKSFTHEINQEEIVYIEIKYKKLYLVTINEILFYTSYTLAQILEMLSEDFIRCHRSYIINKNFIKGIDRSKFQIELKEIDAIVPYGRKYRGLLKGEWI